MAGGFPKRCKANKFVFTDGPHPDLMLVPLGGRGNVSLIA